MRVLPIAFPFTLTASTVVLLFHALPSLSAQSALVAEMAAFEGGSAMNLPESADKQEHEHEHAYAYEQDSRCDDSLMGSISYGGGCDVSSLDQLECGSGFAWDGCSESSLVCLPNMVCTCNHLGAGTWDCSSRAATEFCSGSASTPALRGKPCTPGASEPVTLQASGVVSARAEEITPVSFYGLNYNTRKGPDWAADRERCKSRAEVVRDLEMLARITTGIRLLSLEDCDQGAMVWSILNDELSTLSMEVWLGLWVGPDPQVFIDEYEALAAMIPGIIGVDNWRSRLSGISVGSEAIYREDITIGEAIANLDSTRALLGAYGINDVPVAIVDIAPIYSNSQELRLASDTIMTNTFPFWEGVPIDIAVDELDIDLGWLVDLPESQGKPFVLSEHGWPSAGYIDGVGVASPANQRQYLEESYCYLKQKGWAYYLFTAIDNDWRQEQDPNNTIEGNWGILNANLKLKDHFQGFEFTCPHDGSVHSFGVVDWSVPELTVEDPIDPAFASCGLWQGCEALAGDCCPTPAGDFLGCCRSENFLGENDQQDSPSCSFCVGELYKEDEIINFSNANGSTSCGGLLDLIKNGMSTSFCEAERPFIEDACCREIVQTSSPTQFPTKKVTTPPTQSPTRGPRNPRTPSPTTPPTISPTIPVVTSTPTQSPTRSPTTPPIAPGPSCRFCVGELYKEDEIINFSNANGSTSCGGLLDLIKNGMSTSFCEEERPFIESACCRVATPSPTQFPTTKSPTRIPTPVPTPLPTTNPTTISPTLVPTKSPTTTSPTLVPTRSPTTTSPTGSPVMVSVTESPTGSPTTSPTKSPTRSPTQSPSKSPTIAPTITPSGAPISTSTTSDSEANEEIDTGSGIFPPDIVTNEDKDDASVVEFPWDATDGELPPDMVEANSNSSGSTGNGLRTRVFLNTMLLMSGMIWSILAGWA